jgi:hypothetical protein
MAFALNWLKNKQQTKCFKNNRLYGVPAYVYDGARVINTALDRAVTVVHKPEKNT